LREENRREPLYEVNRRGTAASNLSGVNGYDYLPHITIRIPDTLVVRFSPKDSKQKAAEKWASIGSAAGSLKARLVEDLTRS